MAKIIDKVWGWVLKRFIRHYQNFIPCATHKAKNADLLLENDVFSSP